MARRGRSPHRTKSIGDFDPLRCGCEGARPVCGMPRMPAPPAARVPAVRGPEALFGDDNLLRLDAGIGLETDEIDSGGYTRGVVVAGVPEQLMEAGVLYPVHEAGDAPAVDIEHGEAHASRSGQGIGEGRPATHRVGA